MYNAISPMLQPALEEMVSVARSLFDRGYTFGTAGNLSVRVGNRVLITPTNSSFGGLSPEAMARADLDGKVTGPNKPSKELHFHLAAYRARPEAVAVVHLHSTYTTAVACLRDLNPDDALPVLTPYYAMRVPALPVVDYYPPGHPQLATEVERGAARSPALLLRNHGLISCGRTLAEAAGLAEEVEQQARLFFLLGDRALPLTPQQVDDLRRPQ